MIVIGLIGPIAAGKSIVLDEFRRHGAATIEADAVSRELLKPGSALLGDVIAEFGEDYLDEAGRLRRGRLAALIFADESARRRLERLVHPAMTERMSAEIEQLRGAEVNPPPVVVLEAANLIEMGALPLVDITVLVTAPRNVRLERLMQRDNLSREEAEERLRLHEELGIERFGADYSIDTQLTEAETRRQVELIWQAAVK